MIVASLMMPGQAYTQTKQREQLNRRNEQVAPMDIQLLRAGDKVKKKVAFKKQYKMNVAVHLFIQNLK